MKIEQGNIIREIDTDRVLVVTAVKHTATRYWLQVADADGIDDIWFPHDYLLDFPLETLFEKIA